MFHIILIQMRIRITPTGKKNETKFLLKNKNIIIIADKVIGWKLYSKRKDGVKTTNILEFYNEFIDTKCKKYLGF